MTMIAHQFGHPLAIVVVSGQHERNRIAVVDELLKDAAGQTVVQIKKLRV